MSKTRAAGMKRIVSGLIPDGEGGGVARPGFAALANRIKIPAAEAAAGRWSEDEVSVDGALRIVAELDGHSGAPRPGFMADPESGWKKVARSGSGETCFFLGEMDRFFFCRARSVYFPGVCVHTENRMIEGPD